MIASIPDMQPLHAQARRYTEFMGLPFRNRTWRGQAGEMAGSGVGSSLDFQDHRTYVPGDDPRHINWQAYARTGNYSMKLYREEVRPLVDVVFDVSDSMFFGETKATRSIELFYFCAEAAIRAGASLTCFLIKGDRHTRLDAGTLFSHRWREQVDALQPEEPAAPPRLAALPLRNRSLRAFVSDLLFPGAPAPLASSLAGHDGRGIVLAPFSEEEASPAWQGNYEFVDAETQAHHLNRVEPALLTRYREAYRRHFELWRTYTAKHGLALGRIPSSPNLEKALQLEAVPQGAIEFWS